MAERTGDSQADPEAIAVPLALEQEIKLPFDTLEAAHQAVHTAGGRLVRSRRLIDDRLFDREDQSLMRAGMALRIRRDGELAVLTWKGPVQPGPVKSREEIETTVGDADTLTSIVQALGFRSWFRGQKYREDYDVDGATVVIDEAPFGVFVEIEATPDAIDAVSMRLGRTRADYRLESYPRLWRQWCEAHGRPAGDMVFGG